jgi:DNA-binding NarL/FixJ family response regulator
MAAVPAMAENARQPARAEPIRVFIADDHRITLWGLQQLVNSSPRPMHVVGTATGLQDLLDHPALREADVVVLDLDLGGVDSTQSIPRISASGSAKVLVLTASNDMQVHRQVILQGARGVLHKGEPAAMILKAIEKIHAGEVWVDRALMGQVLGMLTDSQGPSRPAPGNPDAVRIAGLTARERDIIVTMVRCAGMKQMAVAAELGMSENTLRNHLTTIYSKLMVRGRLELHLYAIEHGLGHGHTPGSKHS